MPPDRPVPPSAARLLEETGEDGRGWLEATARAHRLTLELRRQLRLGERLLWACRTGDTLVLHVADRATASSARFAAGAFARREDGRAVRCVIRLGPPCPAGPTDGSRRGPGAPPEALRQLLARLAEDAPVGGDAPTDRRTTGKRTEETDARVRR